MGDLHASEVVMEASQNNHDKINLFHSFNNCFRGFLLTNIALIFTHRKTDGKQLFCETQRRPTVKTRLYKNPPPYFIVFAS